jgi:hypothetical protein
MLNEVRARHIRKLIIEEIAPGRTVGGILKYEIADREHTIRGLEAHRERVQDEILFLKSLDAKELHAESEALRNG